MESKINAEAKQMQDERPSLQELINVTVGWWDSINHDSSNDIPVIAIQRMMVTQNLSPNLDDAGKVI